VVAREGHRLGAKPLGDGEGAAAGHLALRLLAGGHDDPCRRGPQGVEVGLVVGAGDQVLAQQRVGARTVVLAGHAEHRRVGRRLAGDLRAERPLVAGDGDEVRHPGAPAAALVGLLHRAGGRQRVLPVGQDRGERRLVRDQRPHVPRVPGHQRERVDRAAAAGEQVDRPATDRLDEPVQVVGVDVGRDRAGRVGLHAALDTAWVVGHHGAVGEVPRQRGEPGGAHRRADQQQDRPAAGVVAPNVVGQGGAGDVQGVVVVAASSARMASI
jgi:hypothetical protein